MRTLIFATLLTGCGFDEGIIVENMTGKVILPREAATRTFVDESGAETTVTDPRLIGPVYLGLFSAVESGLEAYPSPAQGPSFEAGIPGNTYPYGGTSLGDIRFPCMETLKCRVVSGRYVDFDEMVDWFNNTLRQPITDSNGAVVTSGDYIEQTCFDLLDYTTRDEIRLTALDENEDGQINAADLDFQEQTDGTFAADFTIWQQEYFEDGEDQTGFSLWGWMDAPSEQTYKFTTCDPNGGYNEQQYNRDFFAGRPYNDLLNRPTQYIASGDWVSSTPYVYRSAEDKNVTITLDFLVGL